MGIGPYLQQVNTCYPFQWCMPCLHQCLSITHYRWGIILRNAFEILVLTAVNHSETDWNIRHAFRIWAYTDYFGSPTTPLMSVFGVRSECVETPKKK